MREVVQSLEESRIREVANEGLGRSDVLKFWFGESDEVTPDFIRDAAIASLQKGETFYAHNLGLPELRQAVSDYMSHLHGPIGVDRLAITSGGSAKSNSSVNTPRWASMNLLSTPGASTCRR